MEYLSLLTCDDLLAPITLPLFIFNKPYKGTAAALEFTLFCYLLSSPLLLMLYYLFGTIAVLVMLYPMTVGIYALLKALVYNTYSNDQLEKIIAQLPRKH